MYILCVFSGISLICAEDGEGCSSEETDIGNIQDNYMTSWHVREKTDL